MLGSVLVAPLQHLQELLGRVGLFDGEAGYDDALLTVLPDGKVGTGGREQILYVLVVHLNRLIKP